VGAPPKVTIPSIPSGFVPVNPLDLKGFHPMASEIGVASDAVLELQSFTNYVAVFGMTAPDQALLVTLLGIAAQWTSLLTASTNWLTYVRSNFGLAWKDAVVQMEALKAPFQLAVTRTPSLMSQYPALGRLLGAQKVVAKRAASARAKRKKTAPTNAATPPTTSSGVAAPAAAPPATPVAGATGAGGPVVTVQT
jgi:hypothetical protein